MMIQVMSKRQGFFFFFCDIFIEPTVLVRELLDKLSGIRFPNRNIQNEDRIDHYGKGRIKAGTSESKCQSYQGSYGIGIHPSP